MRTEREAFCVRQFLIRELTPRSPSEGRTERPGSPAERVIQMDDAHFGLDDDTLHEECGVFGILGHEDAATLTALGLHALQHRGQEAAGIVCFDGQQFHSERRMGLVGDHYTDPATLALLPGHMAIGHVRYSTTGETILRNVQPLFAELNDEASTDWRVA